VPRKHNRTGRSKNPDGDYALLPYSMLKSPAWRSLGGNTVRVLLELHTRFHGCNNGEVFLSLEEAAELLTMSKATALAALRELVAKGFLRETRKGGFIRGHATTYALTFKPTGRPTGEPPRQPVRRTDDWRNWTPPPAKPPKPRKAWGATKRDMPPAPEKTFPGAETERIAKNTVSKLNVTSDEAPIGSDPKPYRALSGKNTVSDLNAYSTTTHSVGQRPAQRLATAASRALCSDDSASEDLQPLDDALDRLRDKIAANGGRP
jgi:hypothetical protein